jgi:hypothetical protein
MRKLLALSLFGLLAASQAHAQAQPPAPAQAQASAPAAAGCQGTDKMAMRGCNQQKLKDARKALNQKIADACKKQGVKGPDLMSCRLEMLGKAASAIN